ncbi:GyrI-like domain-containing protein [Hoeflea ulvae]|uniref:GyrI-like domain-containing protein n=1 Tax=Hoeflea ulvae TaxID=2983764 RepID=A0ABT3YJU3_9HYPH|nr:GyrI-like domain-containing protein [Hoeflea ulvae]MCY0095897.1 GyrI-like domain-containing protein [Hoeflea ulvae]
MKIGTPTVVEYAARPYVALRRQVVMPIGKDATETMDQLVREIEAQGVQGTGAAIFKYNIVKMPELEMEFGFETRIAQTTTGELMSGILPAGRYAELIFVGPYRYLTKVNGALIDWSRQNGLAFDMHPDADGDHFASRVEFYPNSPQDVPDPDKLKTIVAIKLKD